nr:vegetative cell wall protein gp1-like [Penaeus vannamei]
MDDGHTCPLPLAIFILPPRPPSAVLIPSFPAVGTRIRWPFISLPWPPPHPFPSGNPRNPAGDSSPSLAASSLLPPWTRIRGPSSPSSLGAALIPSFPRGTPQSPAAIMPRPLARLIPLPTVHRASAWPIVTVSPSLGPPFIASPRGNIPAIPLAIYSIPDRLGPASSFPPWQPPRPSRPALWPSILWPRPSPEPPIQPTPPPPSRWPSQQSLLAQPGLFPPSLLSRSAPRTPASRWPPMRFPASGEAPVLSPSRPAARNTTDRRITASQELTF